MAKRGTLQVGDTVTCKIPETAYYSDYGPNKGKIITFDPGMIGIVATTDTPYVTGRNTVFCCVDFTSPVTGKKERVGLDYSNIVKVRV